MNYKIPLMMSPQPEGGYVVTSPILPELVTEGETAAEALDNVKDALAAVMEIYEDQGRDLPNNAVAVAGEPVWFETVVASP